MAIQLSRSPGDATHWPHLSRKRMPQHFRSLGFQRGAEIGVWRGEFAAALCAGIPGLELIGVDPWEALEHYRDSKNEPRIQDRFDAAYVAAQQNLAPYDAHLWRMTSADAVARVPDGWLDFVFIDGDHSKASVLFDLEAWSPKVRSGGIVCGHDYVRDPRKPFIEVVDAVHEFVERHAISPWFVCGTGTPCFLWVKP